MTYFVHKHGSGAAPQSGYTRISRYVDANGVIWILWKSDLTAAEIRAAISGTLYVVGDDADADVLAVYPEILTHKKQRVRAGGSALLLSATGEYSAEERETWAQQELEAAAYTASGDEADAPMLTAYAAIKGVAVADLAASILTKVAAFKAASGQILGTQAVLLQQVTGAADLATALDIEWS